MSTAKPRKSAWQRFLKGKTPGQRLLIQLAAIATALAAIAGAITAIVALVGGPTAATGEPETTAVPSQKPSPGGVATPSPEPITVVRTKEESANQFVQFLIDNDGGVVQLNHQIHGDLGPADVTLEYRCQPSGRCSTTRVQAPDGQPDGLPPDARWYRGCWQVTVDGAGYGVADLDLQLRPQSKTC